MVSYSEKYYCGIVIMIFFLRYYEKFVNLNIY
ncbi:putative transporter YbjL [Chryseobacterium sp. SORGH_AS909]|uniref:Transporter YbjL n=1 Tax=Chryseobacterium camelliae TaxID=1265445 RepID=A0ABU0TNC2_9FLAO|nr:putative transporter YbjL [Chryseobacterium camelliae]MDQ1102472.1 putative transporter YbjL [Chryseobacterium sp. SORGH_AS_1048]MDR6085906.1 putative transporter YbjL [Chryseobacterium sp. SORGH_AS_0909]MDR6130272.1 putative transporter YbjL [Chryseobacterium sp. SORGH_AS_1175]MDT3407599.1 putative transporter YbjL [Pseudacidovorax intermedius]